MNSYWKIALIISFAFHTAIISGAPSFLKDKVMRPERRKTKEIEIIPNEIEKIKEPVKEELALNAPKPLPYVDNLMGKLIESDRASTLAKPQVFEAETQEVIFADVPSEKEMKKNPAYMNYYRLIREKIRSNAYHNYNSDRKGEILIGFLVNKDGSLSYVSLIPESVSNKTLREIALKSVKESAPFPAFPPELKKYSQLRFSISIYFKNN
jgi:outer membrane biosynthesis protein TonB